MKKILICFAIMAIVLTCGVTFLDSRPSVEYCEKDCLERNPGISGLAFIQCVRECSGQPYPIDPLI